MTDISVRQQLRANHRVLTLLSQGSLTREEVRERIVAMGLLEVRADRALTHLAQKGMVHEQDGRWTRKAG